MSTTQRFIKVPFKEVYSSTSFNYEVNISWSLNEMVANLLPKISVDFNIAQETIEIIPSNQYEECVPVEVLKTLDELQIGNNIFYEEYESDMLVAFYVRRKNYLYERRPNLNECVVCLNERITTNSFGCIHQLCNRCSNGCRNIGHNRCPVCRQNLIGEAM
jgi:CRISPR/Cas system-associated protein Cas10 (large subunit of type III CRISPR-Cas system)